MILLYILLSFPYGEVIVDLGVRGVTRADTSLVITVSGLKVGDRLTEDMGKRALKNIYNLDLFSDVSLEAEKLGAGIRVWFDVVEYPLIISIDFKGNKKVKNKSIKKLITLSQGDVASDKKLFSIKRNIINLYEKKGYFGTEVDIEKDEVDGGINVVFTIKEGKKLIIRKVYFYGNEHFSDKKLTGVIKNKPKWWIIRKGRFHEENISDDIEKIQEFYRNHGFADARVDSNRVEKDGSNVFLHYWVSEGNKYYFGEGDFSGNKHFKTSRLNKVLKWHKGNVYNENKVKKTLQSLYELYSNDGYLYAQIVPDEKIPNDTIYITFNIQEGNPVYVHLIKIKGNTKTYDKVIRRELRIFPGDLFTRDKVIESQQQVFKLGYFEDVNMNIEGTGDTVNLVFKVKEKQVGQFSLGMGYSKQDGLTGNIGASVPNFLGRGENVYIKYERGSKLQNASGGFTEPWLFDTPTTVGFDLYSTQRRWTYYTQKRQGGDIRLGRIFENPKFLKAYATYTLEKEGITIEDSTNVTPYILDQKGERLKSMLSFSLIRDGRNSYIAPTGGSYFSFSPEFSGGYLGGKIDYQKYVMEERWFMEILPKWVFMVRFKGGWVDSLGGRGDVPLTERFVLGGVGPWGLRGYPDRSIGPKSGNYVIGGKAAIIYTLEFRRNITKTAYALAFFDMGNTFNEITDFSMTNMKKGVGVGFRIELPMVGLIGFDFGYGINREGGKKWEPHFQFGMGF